MTKGAPTVDTRGFIRSLFYYHTITYSRFKMINHPASFQILGLGVRIRKLPDALTSFTLIYLCLQGTLKSYEL